MFGANDGTAGNSMTALPVESLTLRRPAALRNGRRDPGAALLQRAQAELQAPPLEDAAAELISLVQDYYQAREGAMKTPQPGVAPYKPLPPRALYLTPNELKERIATATGNHGSVPRCDPVSNPTRIGRRTSAAGCCWHPTGWGQRSRSQRSSVSS